MVRLATVLALVLSFARIGNAVEKLPPPNKAKLVAAERTLDEVYRKEIAAARTVEQKKQLAQRLLTAAKTTEEPELHFAVLEQVEQLGISARDFGVATGAIDALAARFDIHADQRRLAVYEKIAATARTSADHLAIAQQGVELLDAANAADNLELATRYGRAALTAAKKSRDGDTAKKIEERAAMLVAKRKAADGLRDLEAALAVTPNDRGLHQQLGEILCFTRNQWDKGLPHLVKGADRQLAELATRDLAAPTAANDCLEIGDAWLERSKTVGKTQVMSLQARALFWYQKTTNGLTGLTKARVEKQVEELTKATAPLTQVAVAAGGPLSRIYANRARARYSVAKDSDDEQLEAIDKGLGWLVEQQRADGSWCFEHRTGGTNAGSFNTAMNGSTAMALLPLLSAGHTHKEGEYSENVLKGLEYLVRSMKVREGGLGDLTDPSPGAMYSHSLASVALCEAYGMTGDRTLRDPAQATMLFIAAAQDPVGGGWRYQAKQPGDTSVCGWQLQALFVGHHGGLVIPPNTLLGANKFLDKVQQDNGAAYGYTNPGNGPGTTAVGLYSRQLLGWKLQEQPALVSGVESLIKMGPSKTNMYFNYFATYAMKNSEEHSESWVGDMRNLLIDTQAQSGPEAGSWFLPGDLGSTVGGRLYCTSLALLTLESNFRYAPP